MPDNGKDREIPRAIPHNGKCGILVCVLRVCARRRDRSDLSSFHRCSRRYNRDIWVCGCTGGGRDVNCSYARKARNKQINKLYNRLDVAHTFEITTIFLRF